MRRTLTLAPAVLLALAGCALPSTPTSSDQAPPAADTTTAAPSAAQKLADLDGDSQPVTDYQAALQHLAAKCTQDLDKVAGIVFATQADLQKNNVKDETEYSVIQHLDQSIPASAGKMDCVGQAAAYATLRESH
ncbi:hypothetical protein ABIA32_000868 [Streptacidiphilus sp. MAP12-20]|uniref:hypothetical protein n=1 Tax=Streptacidiphilus sp. MAP12-20 TaxID=3156299 RepID=UPI0035126781